MGSPEAECEDSKSQAMCRLNSQPLMDLLIKYPRDDWYVLGDAVMANTRKSPFSHGTLLWKILCILSKNGSDTLTL